VRHARLGRIAKLVEHQRVRLLAEAPVDHQHDDLQVVERHRVAGRGHRAVDHDLAHRRRQHARAGEEGDESQALCSQVLLLARRVHAHAARRGGEFGEGRAFGGGVLRGEIEAVEPDERFVDLLGLEALRAQAAFELLKLGA
jgi:hypothetical protein